MSRRNPYRPRFFAREFIATMSLLVIIVSGFLVIYVGLGLG